MTPDTVFFVPTNSLSEEDTTYYVGQHPDIAFVSINPVYPVNEIAEKLQGHVSIAAGRGNTVMVIKNNFPQILTAEIPITAYDVMRSIEKAGCRGRTVAVITNNANILGLEMITSLLGVRLLAYLLTPFDRLPQIIRRAMNEGAEAILGGGVTCRVAREMHVPAHMLQLGPEGMQQTIAEVRRLRDNLKVEASRQGVIARLMDNIAAGVIAVDQQSKISEINSVMERFLRCDKSKYLGLDIGTLIPDIVRHPPHTELEIPTTIAGTPALLNRTPVMHQRQACGSVITIHEHVRVERMESALRREAQAKPHVARYHFTDVIGKSSSINMAVAEGKSFARTDDNILISGESGTGKEVFAQSIHNESARKNEPFVAVNCAALPNELFQSELFGYVEGAFTSAQRQGKAGRFEVAHKGTIFLDEVSEMAVAQQAALLRVIQERYIVRLGSNAPIPVDVRIIAATNKDLKGEVEAGRFREDLYYRLNVLSLSIPPLRRRKSDIATMFRYFVGTRQSRFSSQLSIETGAFEALEHYDWPGNIRELQNVCARATAIATSPLIDREIIDRVLFPHHAGKTARGIRKGAKIAQSSKEKRQTSEIANALDESGGNMGLAATRLGIDRSTLWRRMKRNNLL